MSPTAQNEHLWFLGGRFWPIFEDILGHRNLWNFLGFYSLLILGFFWIRLALGRIPDFFGDFRNFFYIFKVLLNHEQ